MDTYRSKINHSNAIPARASVWKDDGSTVGFARLQEEEGVLSPLDMQRSVYGNMGTAVTTSANEAESKAPPASTMGIMKEVKVDQRSDLLDKRSMR